LSSVSDQATVREWLRSEFAASSDFVNKELQYSGMTANLFYIKSICDEDKIQRDLVLPFYKVEHTQNYESYIGSLTSRKQSTIKLHELLQHIINGEVLVLAGDTAHLVPMKKAADTTLGQSEVENSVVGSKRSFSEELDTSINIIRSRYTEPSLIVERTKIETRPKTEVAIVYDRQLVDDNLLEKVRADVKKIKPDLVVQAAGQLQRNLTTAKRTLFPTMMITERPDRVVLNLSQGKVALLLHGTPFALIVPAVFFDFMSSMDDLFTHFWGSRFGLTLRYIGLFLSLTLASFYVAFTSYNPEFLRVQLALSIAGSRAPVPYPSYIEVLFMLIMMELLTEASIRLPRSIGSTATTVGGLILGTAATQAGLVSNIMIIIVACVAISNFVVPINEMMYATRIIKYVFLTITTMFGVMGLVVAMIGLLVHLTKKESYGQPYLKLFWENPRSRWQARRME
jgi:spore germination protein